LLRYKTRVSVIGTSIEKPVSSKVSLNSLKKLYMLANSHIDRSSFTPASTSNEQELVTRVIIREIKIACIKQQTFKTPIINALLWPENYSTIFGAIQRIFDRITQKSFYIPVLSSSIVQTDIQ
jgi:hypothetical protein